VVLSLYPKDGLHYHNGTVNEHSENIFIPRSEGGLIPTLNRYGYMLENPDVISHAFVQYAAKTKGLVLDIGSAYGVSVISALQNGATVIANDLDERHLQILVKNTPYHLRKNLSIIKGKFPNQVDLQVNSVDAVLASGVLHYLTGEELVLAIQKIFSILKTGGKFFFFTSTPYIGIFQKYLETYLSRKARGDLWPGLIRNSWVYAPHRKEQLPKEINLLDKDIIFRLLTKCGFEMEQIEYVNMEGYPMDFQSDGKEYIGVIAQKPIRLFS
jgi:SAM-dependent methyltransferase